MDKNKRFALTVIIIYLINVILLFIVRGGKISIGTFIFPLIPVLIIYLQLKMIDWLICPCDDTKTAQGQILEKLT